MSIDIELWEPKALAGFDIDRFKPKLVCIEAHQQVRQQILDYFAHHRYVVVGKYLPRGRQQPVLHAGVVNDRELRRRSIRGSDAIREGRAGSLLGWAHGDVASQRLKTLQ